MRCPKCKRIVSRGELNEGACVHCKPRIKVKVGIMKAEVKPGPDKKFGTTDDKVEIKPVKTKKTKKVKKVSKPDTPTKTDLKTMKKKDLQKLAQKEGVDDSGLKDTIVSRLLKYFKIK